MYVFVSEPFSFEYVVIKNFFLNIMPDGFGTKLYFVNGDFSYGSVYQVLFIRIMDGFVQKKESISFLN